jgi:hypothetical protein
VPAQPPSLSAGNSADDFAMMAFTEVSGALFIDSKAISADTEALVAEAKQRGWAVHTPRGR